MLNNHFFNKKKNRVICIFLLTCFLCGCSFSDNTKPIERQIEDLSQIDEIASSDSAGVNGTNDASDTQEESLDSWDGDSQYTEREADPDERKGIDFDDLRIYSESELSYITAKLVGQYGYEQLNAQDKTVYKQIYLALSEMTNGAKIDCTDENTVKRVFDCVCMDHPELFWIYGYTYTKYVLGDSIVGFGFWGNYICDEKTRIQKQEAIDSYVSECLANAPSGDDYEKIKYVYEYIIRNTDYDLAADDNQNICSVFIGRKSVCQGYAKALQYILNLMGIRCSLVTGTTDAGEPHAWNFVYSDGSYYYIDVTWGDASYQNENGDIGRVPDINYDYLCVPSSDIEKTHFANSPVSLPYCSAMADNYYVRENAFFTYLNEEQLHSLFDKKINDGSAFVTIKCSDSSVYNSIKQYLINEQNIFNFYQPESGKVSYWEQEDSLLISFWL